MNMPNIININLCKYKKYLDSCNIGDCGALHITKSKWDKLKKIYIGNNILIKIIIK